ncbi:hypothetical protein BDN70DRAFT_882345 [Pholiota conissans]|uniref:Uncharacterized protein n=1 Tax=Pholiota conissans TaxID=109636 RepID=A0A9P6CRQ2_9AGAR|nr:hypothetical protein BDN70DRAFT_882345 [Pholiota conissans]
MALPIELTDNIIDKAIAIVPPYRRERTKVLEVESALALVSHSFRQRTNMHRFATVSLVAPKSPFNIDPYINFPQILQSKVWNENTGIARHLQKIILYLEASQDYCGYDDLEHREDLFEDGAIEDLLKTLYNGDVIIGPTPAPTLVVTTNDIDLAANFPLSIRSRMNWRYIDQHFRSTLQGLLKEGSRLTRLKLEGIFVAPKTLLEGSRITHLSLTDFELVPPNKMLDIGKLKYLEILELKPRTAMEFEIFVPDSEDGQLRCLKKLIIHADVRNKKYGTSDEVLALLSAIVPKISPTCDVELFLNYFRLERERKDQRFSTIIASGNNFEYASIDRFLNEYFRASHSAIIIRLNTLFDIESDIRKKVSVDLHTFSEDCKHIVKGFFHLMDRAARHKEFAVQTSDNLKKRKNGISIVQDPYEATFSVIYTERV